MIQQFRIVIHSNRANTLIRLSHFHLMRFFNQLWCLKTWIKMIIIWIVRAWRQSECFWQVTVTFKSSKWNLERCLRIPDLFTAVYWKNNLAFPPAISRPSAMQWIWSSKSSLAKTKQLIRKRSVPVMGCNLNTMLETQLGKKQYLILNESISITKKWIRPCFKRLSWQSGSKLWSWEELC